MRLSLIIFFIFLFPVTLLSSAVVRINALSFVYLLFLLVFPFVCPLSLKQIVSDRNLINYLKLVTSVSGVICIAQFAFHLTALTYKPLSRILQNCSTAESAIRQLGFQTLNNIQLSAILRLILPDVFIFVIFLFFTVWWRKLCLTLLYYSSHIRSLGSHRYRFSKKLSVFSSNLYTFLAFPIEILIIFLISILSPSLLSSVFLFIVIISVLKWSFSCHPSYQSLFHRFVTPIYATFYILLFYLYQFEFFRQILPSESLPARLAGLWSVVVSSCATNGNIQYVKLPFRKYAFFPCLIGVFYFFAFEHRIIKMKRSALPLSVHSKESTIEDESVHGEMEQNQSRKYSKLKHSLSYFLEVIFKLIQDIKNAVESTSYLFSLVAMMVWSVVYHSWLTFLLLMWACIVWIAPNSRHLLLYTSPFYTLYAFVLIVLQFLCHLEFCPEEILPTVNLEQFGCSKPCCTHHPSTHCSFFINLVFQFLLTVIFCLTLKRHRVTRIHVRTHSLAFWESEKKPVLLGRIVDVSKYMIIKYWMFVTTGMLLFISTTPPVVAYKIIYLIFFFVFCLNFMVCFDLWKRSLYIFNILIIVCSMIILISIYLYQFKGAPYFLKKYMNIDKEMLASLGFVQYSVSKTMIKALMIPLVFVVINVIQVQYVHAEWMAFTAEPGSDDAKSEVMHTPMEVQTQMITSRNDRPLVKDHKKKGNKFINYAVRICSKVKDKWSEFIVYIWRFLEIHDYKIYTGVLFGASVNKICLLNLIIFGILLTTFFIPPNLSKFCRTVALLWTCFCIFILMIYQMDVINETWFFSFCKGWSNSSYNSSFAIDSAAWIGFEKRTDIRLLIAPYIVVILALCFTSLVRYRQANRRAWKSYECGKRVIKPPFSTLFFPDAFLAENNAVIYDIPTYNDIHTDLKSFFKYMINFGFYRFGLELTFTMIVVVAAVRMDVFSVVYTLWLGILLFSRRITCSKIWPFFFFFLMISVILQYFIALGFPPFLCWEYPWEHINIRNEDKLREWLFLPSYLTPPNPYKILADYFLIMFVYLQKTVFLEENAKSKLTDHAGSNDEITCEADINPYNSLYDFVGEYKTYMDIMKNFVFVHSFTIVLAVLYATGTTRISVFCLIYLILSFVFFWHGNELLLKPIDQVIRMWSVLLYYCYGVILIKTVIQLIACVQAGQLDCWVVQLFAMVCLNPGISRFQPYADNDCAKADSAAFFMDGLCLIFLLLQRRIYRSYYFQHVIVDLKINSKLASEGAIIYNAIIENEINQNLLKEQHEVDKLKRNIERIQSQQAKMTKNYQETNEHFEAIRSADYYMFQLSEDEADLSDEFLDAKSTTSLQSLPQTEIRKGSEPLDSGTESDKFVDATAHSIENFEKMSTVEKAGFYVVKCYKTVARLTLHFSDVLADWFNKQSACLIEVDRQMKAKKQQAKRQIINSNNNNDDNKDEQPCLPGKEKPRQNGLQKLPQSIYFFVIANSEKLCYLAMILNHLFSASLLSIPLPLSVFLWAMLCVPRPPKYYWVIVITYTEIVIIIKYLYQFRFYPWNRNLLSDTRPLSPVNVLGIDIRGKSSFEPSDLFLLVVLFFHRSVQKRMGLWKNLSDVIKEEKDKACTSINADEKREPTNPLANNTRARVPVRDVYTPMVFCDFITVVIVIFCYSSFGETSQGDVVKSLKANKVPLAFLIMLLVQFIVIIIDRALYLRKNVTGKLCFQIIQVITVHIWLFFVLPILTKRRFIHNNAAKAWYFVKCLYFAYSAIQIRCNYPTRILGCFFTKGYDYIHLFGFKAMLLIPFFYELRTFMDWVFTDTSLCLTSWLQFEDIYTNIYQLKCWRVAEKNHPTERGQRRSMLIKFCTGGIFVILIIFVIWFPLLLFSFSFTFFDSNPPSAVSVNIQFGSYPPLFSGQTQPENIVRFSPDDYSELRKDFVNHQESLLFIKDFSYKDVVYADISAHSANIWSISPPTLTRLVNQLKKGTVAIRFIYTITRKPVLNDDDSLPTITGERSLYIRDPEMQEKLLTMLSTNVSGMQVDIPMLYPRYIHASSESKLSEISSLKINSSYYGNVSLSLIKDGESMWWEILNANQDQHCTWDCHGKDFMTLVIFSDKVSPQSISFVTKYGISGLYATYVILVWDFLRARTLGTYASIMFEELPDPSALWSLLKDIILVRASGSLVLEQNLFDKLILIFRDPQLLLYWTREP